MKKNEQDNFVIEQYKEDEKMMILAFAQWCINEDLDPLALYNEAYPNQPNNDWLIDAIKETVPSKQAEKISHESIMQLLHMFGNDDLAYVVQDAFKNSRKGK